MPNKHTFESNILVNTLYGLPISEHYNRLLASGKEKHAQAILQEFFNFYNEDSPREHLWYMLVMSLKNDNDEITAIDRSNMIFFYEYCTMLFKAIHVLYEQQQNKKPAAKKK